MLAQSDVNGEVLIAASYIYMIIFTSFNIFICCILFTCLYFFTTPSSHVTRLMRDRYLCDIRVLCVSVWMPLYMYYITNMDEDVIVSFFLKSRFLKRCVCFTYLDAGMCPAQLQHLECCSGQSSLPPQKLCKSFT